MNQDLEHFQGIVDRLSKDIEATEEELDWIEKKMNDSAPIRQLAMWMSIAFVVSEAPDKRAVSVAVRALHPRIGHLFLKALSPGGESESIGRGKPVKGTQYDEFEIAVMEDEFSLHDVAVKWRERKKG
jgi:subtilisin-like proprotein convertase family protein